MKLRLITFFTGILLVALPGSAQDLKLTTNMFGTQSQWCLSEGISGANNPICMSNSPGDQLIIALLLSRQNDLLQGISSRIDSSNIKLDTTSSSVKNASDSILKVNNGFNALVVARIEERFDQLPKDIQATDVYKKLREDLIRDLDPLVKAEVKAALEKSSLGNIARQQPITATHKTVRATTGKVATNAIK